MTDAAPRRAAPDVAEPAREPAPWVVLLAAAAGGLAVITVELAAVRMLAPWFGSSQIVWTNVIGVVLLALALGYLLGARLASGRRPAHRLGLLLAAGGAWVAWMPALARRVGDGLVPADLALEDAAGLVASGSLAAALLMFLAPATLLGAAGPLAVESLQRRRGGAAGAAGGHVLAASTLASLVGAFGTGHVALPHRGLERTFWAASLLLVATGLALAYATRRGRRAGLAVTFVVLTAGAAATGGVGPPRLAEGRRLLELAESPYQRVLAVEEGEGEDRRRYLQVNEALDSFQSVWRPEPGLLGEGFYYDDFALPAHWAALEGRGPGPWRTLVLGLGAGSVWRVLDGASPDGFVPEGPGAELDPVVVELGRRWFDLPADGHPRWRVLDRLDGRLALRAARGPFDLVVIDCYANQHELPPHLVTREFFDEVRASLAPGGHAVLNLGAFDLDDPLVPVVGATLAAAFEQPVLALAVPRARNVTLFARRDGVPPEPGTTAFVPEHAGLAARARKAALPGAWRWIAADEARHLTDGHAPLEPLQRASLAYGREQRRSVAP